MADVVQRTITRVLVANRGEIARRVFQTATEMGISTVAVYADGDADAPFVKDADTAIALRGRTATETYLNVDKVLDAARRSGADAIHPGYGFLSENADFASAVEAAGLVWIGPPPEAIAAMGDKLSAKELMRAADVPTLPARELGPDADVLEGAAAVGYPLLIKASAGGGGRGMRVVREESELDSATSGARREAANAFGDDTIFMERWLPACRHVEIQILGDQHGNLLHCFERECSIQRRHQKVIEEAPSSAVTEVIRERMGQAAVAAGKQLGYYSAGTVEFLLDGDDFWFLEVNTRLQVEHPVTEEITGLDLVREQLRIAEGESLGYEQDDLSIHGHAIEARLYAENAQKNFLPSPGTVALWEPSERVDARYDSGIESGSVIGTEFDPMLAKVIVHAPTRREAALRLARALETTRLNGMISNRDFLVATLRTPEFLAGDTTTDFIDRVNRAV
jgi:propionyl-CoA carboxylase alpha chain